jgi:DMSO/TMAO reductase YedYZ molybdopterin-dependent catalytic subunit
LQVSGEVTTPLDLGSSDLASMPRTKLSTKDHEGKPSVFEGVLLTEILKKAGVNRGAPLRGGALTQYLLVEARDGYRVVFALPELDQEFTDGIVLLADQRDGKPLVAPEGPLRLVVPAEKRHARWVREVTTLTIQKVPVDELAPAKPKPSK